MLLCDADAVGAHEATVAQVLGRLRQAPTVIWMFADARDMPAEARTERSCAAFLVKPIEVAELLEILGRLTTARSEDAGGER